MASNLDEEEIKNSHSKLAVNVLAKQDKDDLKRGKWLLVGVIILLVIVGALYIYAHYAKPAGLLAPTDTALKAVREANARLEAAPADILEAETVAGLRGLSDKLSLIAPQLGAGEVYSATLAQINAELGGEEVRRATLSPLFGLVGDIVQVGPGGYFWSGSRDRWVELAFWAFIGTLVFLLSEIKKFCTLPYQELQGDAKPEREKRNFIKFTPWYFANLFRGPFIAMVILVALTSISIEAVGISIDVKSAPIEALVVLAAILGYYSRVADKQLDIIAQNLLSKAWEVANPKAKDEKPAAEEAQPADGVAKSGK